MNHNIVATGFGSRERDSWAVVERTLDRKLRASGLEAELSQPIESSPQLGVLAYNCLKRIGIETVGNLVDKRFDDMSQVPNFGRKNIEEVEEALALGGNSASVT